MDADRLRELDCRYLDAASRYALRHAGLTSENPSVGCLIVRGTHVVGRGVTALGGRPHAERLALDEAGDAARGATAYVTLEPCSHYGHTPPCADALATAGVARVVIGQSDPDPRVNGRGTHLLERSGTKVLSCQHPSEPRAIEGFLARMRRGRPFVTLKLAISADGFIGRPNVGRTAISGTIANRQTHLLRMRSDVVMVGIGTAIADDPLLTVRVPGIARRDPARLVIDPQSRLSFDSRLVRTAQDVPLLLAVRNPSPSVETEFRARTVDVVPLGEAPEALWDLLHGLARRGFGSILCEGGAHLAESLLDLQLVDRLVVIHSEAKIGKPGVSAPDLHSYLDRFSLSASRTFGTDRWIEYDRRTS